MNDYISLLISGALSAHASWYFSRKYYLKSIARHDAETSRERQSLLEALREANATDQTLLRQQHIDKAVEALKTKGTAVPYLQTIPDLSNQQKSEILQAAALRHKGREPKQNPFEKPRTWSCVRCGNPIMVQGNEELGYQPAQCDSCGHMNLWIADGK